MGHQGKLSLDLVFPIGDVLLSHLVLLEQNFDSIYGSS